LTVIFGLHNGRLRPDFIGSFGGGLWICLGISRKKMRRCGKNDEEGEGGFHGDAARSGEFRE
jgi:hypothetical protein